MNTIYRFPFFLFLFFCQSIFAQPVTEWSKFIGGSAMDTPSDIFQTNDDGFLIIGSSDSNEFNTNGGTDVLVTKTNASGITQWSKAYGTSGDEHGFTGNSTLDGGFIVAATRNGNIWILKMTSSGTVSWDFEFGGSSLDIPANIISLPDGGFIIGATSYSSEKAKNGLGDFWIFKINSNGGMDWEKSYGGSRTEQLQELIATSDGGYMAIGTTSSKDGYISNPKGQTDVFIVRMNQNGDLTWAKTYGHTLFDKGSSICEISNNQFVFVGTTGVFDPMASGVQQSFDNNIFVMSISGAGSILWEKSFGGTKYDFGGNITSTDGGVIIGGITRSFNGDITTFKGSYDVWLSKLDNQGSKVWQKSYGGNREDRIKDLIPDRNGGYVILAETNSTDQDISFSFGNQDIWLYKLEGSVLLTVNLGEDKVICSGAAITIDATVPNCNGCSYQWDSGHSTASITVSPSVKTTYTVTVTNGGLQASDNILVSIGGEPQISETITPVRCNGESTGTISLDVNSSNPPLNFEWSNNQSGSTIYNLAKGSYSVTISDGLGCEFEYTYIITQPSKIIDDAVVENICGSNTKGSIHLSPSGGVGSFTYLWNDDNNNQKERDNLSEGMYTVTIFDNNECQLIESFEILENSISYVPTVTNISCYGSTDGKIDLNLTGNVANYNIKWSPNYPSTPIIEHLSVGDYRVTITNSLGCSSMETFSISQPNPIVVSVLKHDNVCFEDMLGEIELSIQGGTSPYEYDWSNGKQTSKISNLASGQYQLTLTDAQGCELNKFYRIKEPKELKIEGTATFVKCAGEYSGSIVVLATGGTPDYNVTINGASYGLGFIGDLAAGDYHVVVQDMNQCEVSREYMVQEPSPLGITLAINNPTPNMENGSIHVTPTGGTPGYSITWDDGSNGESRNNIGKGVFTVNILDVNGCHKDTTFSVLEMVMTDVQDVDQLSIFPNPTTGQFIISIDDDVIEKVMVFNAIGTEIPIKNEKRDSKINVDISMYINGVYFLVIETATERYISKLVLLKP